MATIAELLVRVRTPVDLSGIDRATSSIESFGGRVSSIGQSVRRTGQGLTLGLTAPLLLLGNEAVNTASRLNESINAIRVVFGPASAEIERFGQTSAQTVGLSTRAFNELVTPVGAALQNVGFSADEAAQSSIDLATRAADMASVFNTDVSSALEAIQAGLRGEADPLERFGVGLSETAVQAHALELGLGGAGRELTAQERATARLSLIMGQTEGIAGDFANTSSEVANQSRIAAAEAENQAAAFGDQLLPVKQRLIEVAGRLLDMFDRLPPSMQTGVIASLGVAAALGPVLTGIGGIIQVGPSLISGFAAMGRGFMALSSLLAANPFILIVAAIAAVVVLIIFHWDTIMGVITGAWKAIKGFVSRNWPTIIAIITGPVGILVMLLIRHWNTIRDTAVSVFSAVIGFFTGIPGRIRDALSWVVNGLKNLFSNAFGSARDAVSQRVDSLMALARGIPGRIINAIGNLASTLIEAGKDLIRGLIRGIRNMLGPLGDVAGSIGGFISDLKGPLPKDRRLLIPQGRAIIVGLIRGMRDRLPSLRDQVMSVNDVLGATSGMAGMSLATTSLASTSSPAVAIENATFTDQADVDVLFRQADFAQRSRRF